MKTRACLAGLVLYVQTLLHLHGGSLVPTNATWKYLDNGTDQGSAWRAVGFDDSAWASGPAELGVGDGDEATIIQLGQITTYFRHAFNVVNPGIYGSLTFRLNRDDGAAVYLNGTEIYRSNMPTGAVSYATFASSSSEGGVFLTNTAPNTLVAGLNVVAVEVHQQNTNSADISFALELIGEEPLPLVMRIPNFTLDSGAHVAVDGTPGTSVTIQVSDTAQVWSVLQSGTIPATGSLLLTNAFAGAGRFYRALREGGGSVYSVNVVGVYRLSIPPGHAMIANHLLDTNNSVSALLPSVAPGTSIYKITSDNRFAINNYLQGWSDAAMQLKPGDGIFIRNPTGSPVTVAFKGELVEGTLVNALPNGFTICSSIVPQGGLLQTDLQFPAADDDIIYTFSGVGYSIFNYYTGEWFPQEPSINAGQAFWSSKAASANWNRTFSVNGGGNYSNIQFSASSSIGQINLFTYNTDTNKGRVFLSDGTTPVSSNFFGQLYVGTTADEAGLSAVGIPAQFLGDSGYIRSGAVTVPSAAPNDSRFFQVRVWDFSFGTNYEAAAAIGGTAGKSAVFSRTVGGGLAIPPDANEFASFSVGAAPVITTHPESQTVTVGTAVTFNTTASGSTPLWFGLRRAGVLQTNVTLGANAVSFTLANVQTNHAGNYSVQVTNISGSATSSVAILTVLPDTDGDGLPNSWEALYGLNPNSAADAAGDFDGDGMTNLEEYRSGTDPTNALSYLRISSITRSGGQSTIVFGAVSNVAYTVEAGSGASGPWSVLGQLPVRPTNSIWSVVDSAPQASRYYRVATRHSSYPPVYSVNTVGYVNVTVASGTNDLVRPSLATGDNSVETMLPTPPNGTCVYVWNPGVGAYNTSCFFEEFWEPPGLQIAPATAFKLYNPSSPFTLTFVGEVVPSAAPSIAVQPQSQFVAAGGNAHFSVTANGTPPLTYQWRKGGVNISGATAATYTINSVSAADAANYSVEVSNAAGMVTSANAGLTVTFPTILPGQTLLGNLGASGAFNFYDFTGNAGQVATVVLAEGVDGGFTPTVELRGPGGVTIIATNWGIDAAQVRTTLPANGNYLIVCKDRSGLETNFYAVSLVLNPGSNTNEADGGLILSGETKSGAISFGDVDIFHFTGNAGETASIDFTKQVLNGFFPYVELHAPDGSVVATNLNTPTASIQLAPLNQSGTHLIVVRDFNGGDTNLYSLSLALTNPPVTFADPNLEAGIRAALMIPTGPILLSDMLSLNASLDLQSRNIVNLSGLEFARNVQILNLDFNPITNVTALSDLVSLRSLSLRYNEVQDISPLSGLTNLISLDIENNPISDLTALAELTNLTTLLLQNCSISNITQLAGLTQLTQLSLVQNHIADIYGLAGLTNLTYLNLGSNPVTNHIAISGLTRLMQLYLYYNSLVEVSFVSALEGLQVLNLYNNSIQDLSPISGLVHLSQLQIANNLVTNLTPLGGMTNLQVLTAHDNQITSIGGLSNLTGLNTLQIQNNSIADVSVLLGLTNLTAAYLELNLLNVNTGTPSHAVVQTLIGRGVLASYLPQKVPTITVQPVSQTVVVNGTASLGVAVVASFPWTVQWFSDGIAIPDATNGTYLFMPALADNGRSFHAVILSDYGSITSSIVTLTVLPCLPAPNGLVAWWKGEDNALDSAAGNHGVLAGGSSFVSGKVGQAFTHPSGSVFTAPSSALNFSGTTPMSVELWAYRTGSATIMHLLGKRNGCGAMQYQLAFDPAGLSFASDQGGAFSGTQLPFNEWKHLAATYDGATFRLYVDGELVGTGSGSLGPALSAPLNIGDSGGCNEPFVGRLDEISIYDRALSSNEVAAIYAAGSAGKCLPACVPPPSGLVAWWPMEGEVRDIVGTNQPSATNALSFPAGRVNSGLSPQAGAYAEIPHSPSLANQRFTFALWARPDGIGPNDDSYGSVAVIKSRDGNFGYGLNWNSNGRFLFLNGPSSSVLTSTSSFPAGSFYFVAGTYDGLAFRLYVNGVLEAQRLSTNSVDYSGSIPWAIGADPRIYHPSFQRTWNGVIDEVTIFNRALSSNEIAAMHAAGSSGICPPQQQTPPSIAGLSGVSGAIGSALAINGSNFSSIASNNIVYFGTVRAVVSTATSTQLVVTVPAGAAYAPVSVTVGGLTAASSLPFSVTFASTEPINGGVFAAPVGFRPSTAWLSGPLGVADMDGDGRNDMVVSTRTIPASAFSLLIVTNRSAPGSLSTNSLSAAVTVDSGSGPGRIHAIADLDGDGRLDLVTSATTGVPPLQSEWDIYRNVSSPGALAFVNSALLSTNDQFITLVAVGDLDGDGRPDLLGKSTNTFYYALRNISSGSSIAFAPPAIVFGSCGILEVGAEVADLDGDGKLDVILEGGSSCKPEILRNIATPGILNTNSFAPRFNLAHFGTRSDISIADFDYDGKLDIAVLSCPGDSVSVFRNIGTTGNLISNSFAQGVSLPVGGWHQYLDVADFDGDGRADIVTAGCASNDGQCGSLCGSNTVSVLQNISVQATLSSNSFLSPVVFPTIVNGAKPTASDMDGDGRPDLVVGTYFASFSIWHNIIPPLCVTPPAGLVAWWRGEGNALDSVGGNHGALSNGATFAAGKVGQGFSFDGVNDYLEVSSSPALKMTNFISVEGWIKFNEIRSYPGMGIVGKGVNAHEPMDWLLTVAFNTGHLRLHVYASENWNTLNCNTVLATGVWHHVAMVYDGSSLAGYINGRLDGVMAVSGSIQATDHSLRVGVNAVAGTNSGYFPGVIDDLALYNRALTSNEIAAIYAAGISGKCPPVLPSISEAPPSFTLTTEDNPFTLIVDAAGSAPLRYQWLRDGTPVAGGTNNALIFPEIAFGDRGIYTVIVSNAYGAVTSSVATVLVRARPWIYWSTAGELPGGSVNSKIKRAWLDGTHVQTVVSNPAAFRFGGIAFDAVNARFFSGDGAWLFRANLDGSGRVNLVSEPTASSVADVELDLLRGHVYWTTTLDNQGSLYRANLDGSSVELVANANGPLLWEGFGLDELANRAFIAHNDNRTNRIDVVDLSMPSSAAFATIPATVPFDAEVDPVNGFVYWYEYGTRRLAKARTDGVGGINYVLQSSDAPGGNGMHLDRKGQKLYFSSGSTNGGASAPIRLNRCNVDGTGAEILLTDIGRINYMEVVYPSETNRLEVFEQGSGITTINPQRQFYDYGDTVTITAVPNRYRRFVRWSDGNTNSERTVTIGLNNSYTAIFEDMVPLETTVLKVSEKVYGGSGDEYLPTILPTSDGGYIVSTFSDSGFSGNKETAGFGLNDVWILKLDGNANKVWERTYGGDLNDDAAKIIQTADGGYLVAAQSSSGATGNRTNAGFGTYDMWLFKLDASGNKLWERTYGGDAREYLLDMIPDGAGGYLLAGSSQSGITGNKGATNFGDFDAWIVRVDAQGNKLWDRSYGGAAADRLFGLQTASGGGFFLIGDSASGADGNKTSPNLGTNDYWLIKIDRAGNKLWERVYGGTGYDFGYRLVPRGAGRFLLLGDSSSPAGATKTALHYGNQDAWIVEIDENGVRLNDYSFGGTAYDSQLALRESARDGGYYLAGFSDSPVSGTRTAPAFGSYDAWLIKTDGSLNRQWEYSLGTDGWDELTDLVELTDGSLLLVGDASSSVNGNKTTPGFGANDVWIVKLQTREAPVGTPLLFVNGLFDPSNTVLVTNSALIEIQSTFPGAHIFFTLDGSDPDQGEVYTGPVTLTSDAIVRAVAYTANFQSSAEADPVLVLVAQTPVIISQPQSQTVAAGTPVQFSVVASGQGPLSYQWYRGEATLHGQTNSTFAIPAAQVADAGIYFVTVANVYGVVFSTQTVLDIIRPPEVTSHPMSFNVVPGVGVTNCVFATGDEPLRYQWRKNGVNLRGETNQCLVITNVQVENGGTYDVVVANAASAVVSQQGQLRLILQIVTAGDHFSNRVDIAGSTGSLQATNFGAGKEPGEPNHGGKPGGSSVWYRWTAPFAGIVTFRTVGSTFDTLLAAYTGQQVANLTTIASDEDGGGFLTSLIRFNALAGQSYAIAVDGFGDTEGEFTLSWELVQRSNPLPVILQQPQSQTVLLGTNVLFTVSASNAATYLWFRNGEPLYAQAGPQLIIPSAEPADVGTYRVAVTNSNGDGIESETAILEIARGFRPPGVRTADKIEDLSFPILPPGLNLRGGKAEIVIPVSSGLPDLQILNNSESTTSIGETNRCNTIGGASRWFQVRALANATMRIDTIGSTIDTILSVYRGTNRLSPGFAAVDGGCDDDSGPNRTSIVRFQATSGADYSIQIDGKNGTNGTVFLNFGLGFAPSNTQISSRQVARQGDNITLTCTAIGTPTPAFFWYRSNQTATAAFVAVTTTGTLPLFNLQPSQQGTYTVVVSNFIASITNTVAEVVVQTNALIAAQTGFDSSMEGWTAITNGGALGLRHSAAGGNPGGHLAVRSVPIAGFWYWIAPPSYLGNKFYCYNGSLTFELRQTITTSLAAIPAEDVILEGAGQRLVVNLNNPSGSLWNTYRVPLNESPSVGWRVGNLAGPPVTRGDFIAVLTSLTNLMIRGTAGLGTELGHLDSVLLLGATTPSLSIRPDGTDWIIEWPQGLAGFTLQAISALDTARVAQADNWLTEVQAPIIVTNNLNQVRVPSLPTQQFFRLHKP